MNSYLKNLRTAQEQLDLTVVQELYHLIRNAYHNGNTIFLCGNGGSAAPRRQAGRGVAAGDRVPGGPDR